MNLVAKLVRDRVYFYGGKDKQTVVRKLCILNEIAIVECPNAALPSFHVALSDLSTVVADAILVGYTITISG